MGGPLDVAREVREAESSLRSIGMMQTSIPGIDDAPAVLGDVGVPVVWCRLGFPAELAHWGPQNRIQHVEISYVAGPEVCRVEIDPQEVD